MGPDNGEAEKYILNEAGENYQSYRHFTSRNTLAGRLSSSREIAD